MRKINKVFGFLVMTLVPQLLFGQLSKDLAKSFNSADWKEVKVAKIEIENLQESAIPDLLPQLKSTEKVKLNNTGSLIYPGAEKFFGHGQILNYDIDYISIRAGWVIEEITFNNFGFSGIHLPKEELINHIKMTFPEYYNNSTNRKKLETSSLEELRKIGERLSVEALNSWWKSEGESWSRLSALVNALKSFDEKRQVKALFYLRNGTTKCKGLTREFYIEEISKEIVRLSGSDVQRISEHAKLILLDSKLGWLEMKN